MEAWKTTGRKASRGRVFLHSQLSPPCPWDSHGLNDNEKLYAHVWVDDSLNKTVIGDVIKLSYILLIFFKYLYGNV